MKKEGTKADRRHQRVATPKGVWVAWQNEKHQNVSRVRDLNAGGMFIATPTPLPLGSVLPVLLSVPEGEIRGRTTVRNVIPAEGMGVQFTEITAENQTRLDHLVARLLMAESNAPSESPVRKLK
jgi:PilZ domain-containing protein